MAKINRRGFLGKTSVVMGWIGSTAGPIHSGEGGGGDGVSGEPSRIDLPPPRLSGGRRLMEVLRDRATSREFSQRPLPEPVLSNLLWAAFGVNRPDTGKRTAPSAMDNREIDIVVATASGAFLYEPVEHRLRRMTDEDLRPTTGTQAYVQLAPVSLIYVADHRRQVRVAVSDRAFYAAADAGFIGQNVYLFCASEGLASVVHVVPQSGRLTEKLGCVPEQEVVLAQCVGYPESPQAA
jgi:nitroreductase